MLTPDQIQQFERQGYLVVPDVIPPDVLSAVKAEYAVLIDDLYDGWYAEGRVKTPPAELDFWGKLLEAYVAKCDWFQPMDICLPNEQITADTRKWPILAAAGGHSVLRAIKSQFRDRAGKAAVFSF